ncbi:MAG: 50S ribosomal protein L25 [Prevotella sp.]|nr:50S ribosomal protein L25 [Prevotella sp.]
MKEINVTGTKRSTVGKKATKALRKQELVPCNLYGEAKDENGKPKALAFASPMKELVKVVFTPHVYLVNLNIDGEAHKAVMREIQFHPTKDTILHIDFFEVTPEKLITVGIPVKLIGLAQGIRDGGRMNLSIRKINVTSQYKYIPETLDIDVTNLTIGKSIKVGELHFDNLEMATSKNVVVCSIKATRKSTMQQTEGEEAPAE